MLFIYQKRGTIKYIELNNPQTTLTPPRKFAERTDKMDHKEKVERLISIYSQFGNSEIRHIGDSLYFTGFIDVSLYTIGYVDNLLGRRYFLSERSSDIECIPDIHVVLKDYFMEYDTYICANEIETIEFSDFDIPLMFFYVSEDYYESIFVQHK